MVNKNLYLLGFMGSGKSYVGKHIAEKIGWEFCDLDAVIERKMQCTISEIFDEHGEDCFRQIEHQCLKELLLTKKTVVALGGGTPCFHDNISLIKKRGVTFFLDLSVDVLYERLIAETHKRPLIKGKSVSELKSFIELKLNERMDCYKKAHYIVSGPDNSINRILNIRSFYIMN
ncbi:MAG: hypothetical protein MK207_08390 [Saprospiraceae bacterium]|nr:hypothetical protein [Saprospiraceae bacterium]